MDECYRVRDSKGVDAMAAADGRTGQVRRVSRQCTCPYCGGCFGLDDDGFAPPRVTEYNCRCIRCGHAWRSRSEDPAKCPGCGTVWWNTRQRRCKCSRCGHEWSPRGAGVPLRCPSCKSRDWDSSAVRDDAPIEQVEDPVVLRRRWVMRKYESGDGCVDIASETGVALLEIIRIVMEETGRPHPRLRFTLDTAFFQIGHSCGKDWRCPLYRLPEVL